MKPGLIALLTGPCLACGLIFQAIEGEVVPPPQRWTHNVEFCQGDVPCDYALYAWGAEKAYAGPHLHVTCKLCGKVRAEPTVK